MSKIGKKTIKIPDGVEIKINASLLTAKGPKGEITRVFSKGVKFVMENGSLSVEKTDSAIWGLSRALAANMIQGVSQGFQKVLEFTGVGYKANVKGDTLELNLGFTHPVSVKAPAGVIFKVEKNFITISGPDIEAVGHVAAQIRSKRPPEPYKGSGIKYANEIIRRKAGKKAGVAAGTA